MVVSVKFWAAGAKVAMAVRAASMVTVHTPVPAPAQAPDQPAKVEPAAAAAVSETLVPEA